MNKEYFYCPNCGSEDITADSYGTGTRIVDCLTCHFSWLELYEIVENTDLDGNPLPDPE